MPETHDVCCSFMNLSHPKRHLVTRDPDPDSYLPVDDLAWDSGVSEPACVACVADMSSLTLFPQHSNAGDAVKLSLSSQVHIGRFARFVHAVPLLSHAITRSGEEPDTTTQLRRTLLSLTNLGGIEGDIYARLFCTLHASCFTYVL